MKGVADLLSCEDQLVCRCDWQCGLGDGCRTGSMPTRAPADQGPHWVGERVGMMPNDPPQGCDGLQSLRLEIAR